MKVNESAPTNYLHDRKNNLKMTLGQYLGNRIIIIVNHTPQITVTLYNRWTAVHHKYICYLKCLLVATTVDLVHRALDHPLDLHLLLSKLLSVIYKY